MTARQSRRSVADIYELSPMQEAMLFHCTYAPESRAYFDQFSCRIEGLSRPDDFRESWQTLSDRHAVLRTSFHWQDLPKPMQVVHESVVVPWTFEDWSHLNASGQSEKWQGLLEEDRKIGFVLEQAPLFRCKLARLNSDTCLFAWSHHHIILDGWCLSLILSEIFETYNGLGRNQRPAAKTVPRYRDYIVWLQAQDQTSAREFWAGELKGSSAPTELSAISPIRGHRSGGSDSRLSAVLSEERSTELRSFAAHRQLTINTLVQGAWSVLLHRYSGESDILFGATVSGRSADVTGIEQMLGVFINTIPIRVHVDPDSELVPYLKKLQELQAFRSRNAFLSLKDIRQSGGIPHGSSLFHTNLI
ncbi:MAG: condensation domain-containing protein, partial [Blastocatellia bacterium]